MSAALNWLAAELAQVAGPALSALTGRHIQASADGTPFPEDSEGFVFWRQDFDAAPGAGLWAAAGPEFWRQVGGMVLQAAGLDDAAAEEIRGTYLEALQQMLSPLGGVAGARLGREVNLRPGREEAPPAGSAWAALRIEFEDGTAGHVFLAISPELAALLEAAVLAPAADPAPEPRKGGGRQQAAPQSSSKTLELLLEVELPVGVSFGRTQMRVKDAIKLTTGSIVELNRSVSAPVEIIVNNCVIARGEVVVVEGNYGVRIQEIVSREERLRTLF